jgi:hypothetical protein
MAAWRNGDAHFFKIITAKCRRRLGGGKSVPRRQTDARWYRLSWKAVPVQVFIASGVGVGWGGVGWAVAQRQNTCLIILRSEVQVRAPPLAPEKKLAKKFTIGCL